MRHSPYRDIKFYQHRKHGKWREVPAPLPPLEAPVADSHAHIHTLPDPAWELVRCAANGVDFVCEITDPSEDGSRPFDEMAEWIAHAEANLSENQNDLSRIPFGEKKTGPESSSINAKSRTLSPESCQVLVPMVRIAVGVHPHNAKLYTPEIESTLVMRLGDPRVVAMGEVGLDFHYDLSPREVQRDVFRRQIGIAQQCDLPIVLHLRGGEDPVRDNAHREAFDILREAGALGPRTLLHCCALPPDELTPWIEADCYIAYGGTITFKNADAAREGARLVPTDRLLLETDSPYMAPEPMRGAACTPAHVIFTAAALAELRGVDPGDGRRAFLQQIHDNTVSFYRVNA